MNTAQALYIVGSVGIFVLKLSNAAVKDQTDNQTLVVVSKRSTTPTKTCTKDNEGESVYNSVSPLSIWVCKSETWKPYELVPSTGKTKELSANNCKEIKEALSTDCTKLPQSGVYWVQNQQIYCDMTTDGGGWTLVWQHTYMKYKPLHSKMFYFSSSYQPCIKDASHEEWCNVPNKTHFNPTEQMIVAYHKGTMIFAYKGYFNRNIDHHWTGAILLDAKKVIDLCQGNNGVPPAPGVHVSGIFGLNFDKASPTNYVYNCNTYHQESTLTDPKECRWYDCHIPKSISSIRSATSMTMAIFVR